MFYQFSQNFNILLVSFNFGDNNICGITWKTSYIERFFDWKQLKLFKSFLKLFDKKLKLKIQ